MAIAFDTAGGDYEYNTSTSGCTFSLAAASANSIAILFVYANPGSNDPNWANIPTVNGVAATLIGTAYNFTGTQYLYAYYLLNPPTSSVAYTLTTDDIGADRDCELHALIYSDAAQSGQPDSNNTGTGTPTATLSTTVVAANCWLVSAARNVDFGVPTASTGTTARSTAFDTAFASGDSNGTVGTGAQTMAWTAGSGATSGLIISIAPAVAAAVTNRRGVMY